MSAKISTSITTSISQLVWNHFHHMPCKDLILRITSTLRRGSVTISNHSMTLWVRIFINRYFQCYHPLHVTQELRQGRGRGSYGRSAQRPSCRKESKGIFEFVFGDKHPTIEALRNSFFQPKERGT